MTQGNGCNSHFAYSQFIHKLYQYLFARAPFSTDEIIQAQKYYKKKISEDQLTEFFCLAADLYADALQKSLESNQNLEKYENLLELAAFFSDHSLRGRIRSIIHQL